MGKGRYKVKENNPVQDELDGLRNLELNQFRDEPSASMQLRKH